MNDPLGMAQLCHRLGFDGVQVNLGAYGLAEAHALRSWLEAHAMYLVGEVGFPDDEAGLDTFEARVRVLKEAGAGLVRTFLLPGRRYENFASFGEFEQMVTRRSALLPRVERIVARYGVRLGLENHKDQRVAEKLAMLEKLASEYVGVFLDVGNDIALMEDPYQTVEAYAPWAFGVHLKDIAVREYAQGFEVLDVPLGEGMLDLKRMVAELRAVNARMPFLVEMSTRNPLPVPCLTERYWASLPGVSGRELAAVLSTVRRHQPGEPLRRIDGLSDAELIALEEDNVRKCLRYAREELGL